MKHTALSTALLCAVLAATLAPVAAAPQSAALTAQSAQAAQANWSNTMQLGAFTAPDASAGMTVHIVADHAEAVVVRDDGYTVAAGDSSVVESARLARSMGGGSGDDVAWSMAHLAGTLQGSPSSQIHIRGPFDLAGGPVDLEVDGLRDPMLGPFGLAAAPPATGKIAFLPGNEEGDDAYWSAWRQEGDWVRLRSHQGAYVLTGDIEVEFTGLVGVVAGGGMNRVIDTSNLRTQVGPATYHDSIGFARITLTGAQVVVTLDDHATAAFCAITADVDAASLQVSGATGSVQTADQTVVITNSSYVFEGRQALRATPQPAGIALQVVAVDAEGRPLAPEAATARAMSVPQAAILGALAVLIVGGALTVVVGRRLRRIPTVHDVEAALEAGAFARAAREAAAILRRTPDNEDAFVSRAVALSKAEKHSAVVAEVKAHIARHEPTDGTCHYILGVALEKLGQAAEAKLAFAEAARRTPQLARGGALPVPGIGALGAYA